MSKLAHLAVVRREETAFTKHIPRFKTIKGKYDLAKFDRIEFNTQTSRTNKLWIRFFCLTLPCIFYDLPVGEAHRPYRHFHKTGISFWNSDKTVGSKTPVA